MYLQIFVVYVCVFCVQDLAIYLILIFVKI